MRSSNVSKEIRMTENEFDERLNRTIAVGESCGLREASEFLMREATLAFQGQMDGHATLLRRIATEFAKMAEERHPLKKCKKCGERHYPEDKKRCAEPGQ